jgi:hypothetical protein
LQRWGFIFVKTTKAQLQVWLLLRLTLPEYDRPISRKDIYGMLESEILKFEPTFIYHHGKKEIINFLKVFGDENRAISKAKILKEFHKDTPPINRNPSSDVFLLVEELRSWIAFYGK